MRKDKDYDKKLKRKRLDLMIINILFMIFLVLSFCSVYLFMAGFHNVDLAYNVNTINLETGSNYVELNYKDVPEMSMAELYTEGINQMQVSLLFIPVTFFMTGFYFISLLLTIDDYITYKIRGYEL